MTATGPRLDIHSELPWNVAGIPPEAREAARASARREGLSVGEWLTRRIVRNLAEPESSGERWWASDTAHARDVPERPSAHDTVEMLARVSRTETESQNIWRRSEEQLRNLVRRIEQTERSQSESARAMTRAEAEIHVRSHEQAQTLERMDSRVAHLNERILKIEQSAQADGIREAIKALHQGLTRLADQISDTAKSSAEQSAQLATTLGTVTDRLACYRNEEQENSCALANRISMVETAFQDFNAARSDRADITDEIGQHSGDLARLSNAVGDLSREFEAGELRNSTALTGIETRLSKLEGRIGSLLADTRLQSVEREVLDATARLERNERDRAADADSIQVQLRNLVLRLDASDERNAEAMAELGALVKETAGKLEHARVEPPEIQAPTVPVLDLPPLADSAPAPKVLPEPAPLVPENSTPASDVEAPAVADETIHASLDSFLKAARRTARAASDAQTERAKPGVLFSLAGSKGGPNSGEIGHLRLFLLAFLGFLVVAATGAALFLSRGAHAPVRMSETHPSALMHAAVGKIPNETPRDRLAELASSGNAKAQELLGLRYLDGEVEPVNEAEAARWLERAAAKGEAVAAYRLGTLYDGGHGVPADPATAAKWYIRAAKAGNRKAMHNLAVAYAEGSGVPKDPVLAAQWFARAANLGLSDSQFNLGVLYERGMGVPQSLIDAYKWYAIAAEEGDSESRSRIDALGSQLGVEDKAAAEKAATDFRAAPENRAANAPPDAAMLVSRF